MKRFDIENEIRNHDMPHEHIMDENGIEFDELSDSIQQDIHQYESILKAAFKDGYIDDKEEKQLIAESYKIKERILKEHLDNVPNEKGSADGILGVLAGIGIAVGAILGINKIRQS